MNSFELIMLILIYILILSFDETIVGVKKKYYLGNLKENFFFLVHVMHARENV